MGLIKAAKGAIGSTLKDQWKEVIRCEDMSNDILMVKKTTETGVISNKSTIIVAPGQCAVIYDNGRIIDATAEEGLYEFDSSSTPSFFAGQFKDTFKEMWERFTYDGATSKEQAVYFFNTKEIIENKFGTATPVTFQDWSHPLINEMTNTMTPLRVEIKCFGTYTFRISNPALFMSKIAGISNMYTKSKLVEQIKAEVMEAIQNVINELGNAEHKVPVLELQSQTDEIKQIISERNCDEKIKERGVSLVSFGIESVTLTDESEQKIDNYEYNTNSFMQKGRMVDAYANAMENAASNSSGVLDGMIGIGMMNMSTDGIMKEMANKAFSHSNGQKINTNVSSKWECSNCKQENEGTFCSNCGTKKTESSFCSNCGEKVEQNAKFCSECGNKIK